jgi:Flp pilus assembly protein TadG
MSATPSDRLRGRPAERRVSGVLGALRRDTSGNTLAMMAAFLLPLTALAGSAVDMSRAYLVRVRLQQACDAGVLAGRKIMTVNSGTALDDASATPSKPAETQANAFFTNNFQPGWMQTTNVTFTPSRTADGQVTATATATMPMAIMRIFGFNETAQSVSCTARLDIGDSDIMFVLDTTGSMGCTTSAGCSSTATWTRADGTTGYYTVEQSNSKIQALRNAVKLFRTTLANNKPAASKIRYGFVPYSSTVNVGALITAKSSSYIVNTANYASRELAPDVSTSTQPAADGSNSANYNVSQGGINTGDVNYGTRISLTTISPVPASKKLCLDLRTRKTSGGTDLPTGWPTGTANPTLVRELPVWTSGSPNTCVVSKWNVKPLWRYKDMDLDVSTFKNFTSIADPSKFNATTKWPGCIEERVDTTSAGDTSFDTSSLPADIDPDVVPSSDATRWRPLWPEVVFYRPAIAASTDSGSISVASSDSDDTGPAASYTNLLVSTGSSSSLGPSYQYTGCSAPARRLAEMTSTDFDAYLGTSTTGDFRPYGHTYHDVGMIWGLRLLSPNGIWASDTAAWPGNNPPNRYIVFMTDGLMDPDPSAYSLYGIEKYDGRVSGNTSVTDSSLINYHNARFLAACNAARAKNITVFVVAFDVGSTVPATLQSCATPGYAYAATSAAALQTAFSTIALQVAKLRLSQ